MIVPKKETTPKTNDLRAREVHEPKPSAKFNAKRHGTRRGFFVPNNPAKYDGDVTNIVYRSKIELRLMKYLDSHPSVLSWSSEETIVPYVSPLDKKVHRYFVDFKARLKTRDGSIKTYLIEVKWSTATVEPKVPKKKTRRYYADLNNWAVNKEKWKAAKALCEKKGWEWLILTEKQLEFNA